MPTLTGSQKIAVLMCKFTDTASTEPHPRTHYEDMFANVGTGGLNDYWRAASHGKINLDGTKVFGWSTIDAKLADYINDHPGRWDKISGVFKTFPDYKSTDFPYVVVIFNVGVGDEGTMGGVLASAGADDLTFLGHETGHLFGLEHSFDESDRKNADWSAPGEYFDPHDIMSARAVFPTQSARFGAVGPLAAVPHLDRLGWLEPSRTWEAPTQNSSFTDAFDLVSVGHPEKPGYLAAKIGGLYVEFRTQDGFDAGIPRPTVLIHTLRGANPVVLTSDKSSWNHEWLAGMSYSSRITTESGPAVPDLNESGGVRISVLSFDLAAYKARIAVQTTASRRPPLAGAGIPLGGWNVVGSDGGGWVILPSGKLIRIPPRSPILNVVSKLALLAEAEPLLREDTFEAVQRGILAEAQKDIETLQSVGESYQSE